MPSEVKRLYILIKRPSTGVQENDHPGAMFYLRESHREQVGSLFGSLTGRIYGGVSACTRYLCDASMLVAVVTSNT